LRGFLTSSNYLF